MKKISLLDTIRKDFGIKKKDFPIGICGKTKYSEIAQNDDCLSLAELKMFLDRLSIPIHEYTYLKFQPSSKYTDMLTNFEQIAKSKLPHKMQRLEEIFNQIEKDITNDLGAAQVYVTIRQYFSEAFNLTFTSKLGLEDLEFFTNYYLKRPDIYSTDLSLLNNILQCFSFEDRKALESYTIKKILEKERYAPQFLDISRFLFLSLIETEILNKKPDKKALTRLNSYINSLNNLNTDNNYFFKLTTEFTATLIKLYEQNNPKIEIITECAAILKVISKLNDENTYEMLNKLLQAVINREDINIENNKDLQVLLTDTQRTTKPIIFNIQK